MPPMYCSAANDVYYKEQKSGKGVCFPCQPCPPGTGRDFTERPNLRSGPHGDEECYSCYPCPSGEYNRGTISQCRPCTKNKCRDLHREVKENCTRTEDEKCSYKCLPGYIDEHDGEIGIPCMADRFPPQFPVLEKSTHAGPSKVDGHLPDYTIALLVGLALVTVVLVTLIGYFVRMRKHKERKEKRPQNTESPSAPSSSNSPLLANSAPGSGVNLEQEAVVNHELGPAVNPKQGFANLEVVSADNPNRESAIILEVRSTGMASEGPKTFSDSNGSSSEDRIETDGPPPNPHPELSSSSIQPAARNFVETQPILMTLPYVQMMRHKKVLARISALIPNDPVLLFEALGLNRCTYFPELDLYRSDRQTFKEYVYQVLVKWVERKGADADSQTLFDALRHVGFEEAIQELYVSFENL